MVYSLSTSELIIDKDTAEKNFPKLKEAGFGAIDLGFDMIFSKTGGKLGSDSTFTKSEFYELSDEELFKYLDGIKYSAEKTVLKLVNAMRRFLLAGQARQRIISKRLLTEPLLPPGT
ncbi:MAG: hypothetical protein E7568_00815 [Ruminococcaceae bacterium]|nr:hypothetical protein [Oscillospiraceae bacterium]